MARIRAHPSSVSSWLLLLLAATAARAQVQISEFLAAGRNGLLDDDGYAADWIELHNAGPAQNLLGWRLECGVGEQARGYELPDVVITGNGYLVVFASGKHRRDPAKPLHANFRLDRDGGLLRLRDRDGAVVGAEIRFGPQSIDVSQGWAQAFATTALIAADAQLRWSVPKGGLADDWLQLGFDDSGWARGVGAFGFDRRPTPALAARLGTDLSASMRGSSATVCLRGAFEVADAGRLTAGRLRVLCVGAFIVWLNGREIARANLPDKVGPDTRALNVLQGADARLVHEVPVGFLGELLRPGRNVLAVRAFSEGANALVHLCGVELAGHAPAPLQPGQLLFLAEPTPGRPNGDGFPRVTPPPAIAGTGAVRDGAQEFAVTPPAGGGELRYTLDGSEPTTASPACPGRVELAASATLKVRACRPGEHPSEVVAAGFTRLSSALREFRSDLPLVVVTTFGQAVDSKEYVDAHVHVIDRPAQGLTSLFDAPQYSGAGGLRLRGSSTLNLPKRSYGIELRDAEGGDQNVPLLGLGKASEWSLYAPHNYDQAHLRNALCYELARRIGLDAPRTRFCELFVSTDPGEVTAAHYVGLYLLVERIGQGKHRVDIEKLAATDDREPEITGGYLLKIDRPGPGDVGFTGGGQKLQYVYPKEREISDSQRQWLKNWFDRFGSVLAGKEFADPQRGYPAWIDVDNFVDYHFFQEYGKNPDAYTLSTYMYKRRGGKLRMGPIWDFDRAMRTNDDEYWVGRPARPTGWTEDNYYGWWGVLFRDPVFRARYRERGRAHLAGELATPRVHALIDQIAAQISSAEERDRLRWPIIAAGDWYNELAELKQWIGERAEWFAGELLEAPEFQSSGGQFSIPFELSMRHDNPAGVLYYTLDGADPRLRDGRPSPVARVYAAPIAVDRDLQVRARVLVDGRWSRLTEGAYVRQVPTVAITEVMYNPPGGRVNEFIEFVNFGDKPVDLGGLDINGMIRFHFGTGSVKTLQPGQRVVIVHDRRGFADRYDTSAILIAGEFLGRFSNTEGEIAVTGAYGEHVARIHYVDSWYPPTDGNGRSLQAKNAQRNVLAKNDWQASAEDGGSPGR